MEKISKNLKKLRLQKKLTQEQIADALGVKLANRFSLGMQHNLP